MLCIWNIRRVKFWKWPNYLLAPSFPPSLPSLPPACLPFFLPSKRSHYAKWRQRPLKPKHIVTLLFLLICLLLSLLAPLSWVLWRCWTWPGHLRGELGCWSERGRIRRSMWRMLYQENQLLLREICGKETEYWRHVFIGWSWFMLMVFDFISSWLERFWGVGCKWGIVGFMGLFPQGCIAPGTSAWSKSALNRADICSHLKGLHPQMIPQFFTCTRLGI